MSIQDISRNLPQIPANNSEYEPCGSLKALVVAVCTVAVAALGFWVAGQAGLAIGVVAGVGLGFAAVWLISGPTTLLGPVPPRTLEGRQIIIPSTSAEWLFAPLPHDPVFRWFYGTQSLMLSFISAIYRNPEVKELIEAPALIPAAQLLMLNIPPLERNVDYYQKQEANTVSGVSDRYSAVSQAEQGNFDRSVPKPNFLKDIFKLEALNQMQFTEEEADLIENPCPLIFASKAKRLNLAVSSMSVHDYDSDNRYIVMPIQILSETNQPIVLGAGRDIERIYTDSRNIERISRIVAPFGVEVLDIAMHP